MKDNPKSLRNKWPDRLMLAYFTHTGLYIHTFTLQNIYRQQKKVYVYVKLALQNINVINDCLMSHSCILCLLLQLHLIYYLNDQGQI